jgi:hypothetical protein
MHELVVEAPDIVVQRDPPQVGVIPAIGPANIGPHVEKTRLNGVEQDTGNKTTPVDRNILPVGGGARLESKSDQSRKQENGRMTETAH